MKIAIVCNGRSGSTSLFNLIKCLLSSQNEKYEYFFEPFNFNVIDIDKHKTIDVFTNDKNILIKTFINNDNYPYESFNNSEDYWSWFFQYFDKIIVLERENKREQSESLVYHFKIKSEWHKQKFYNLTEDDEEDIVGITKHLEEESKNLRNISKRGYPLFTYEDIFVRRNQNTHDELLRYLSLNHNQKCFDDWILSPYRKVRIEKKTNNLI